MFKKSFGFLQRGIHRIRSNRYGFGMNELLGIAAALILAAFIIIPGLKGFAGTVMTGLTSWWTDHVATQIFPASS